MSDPKKIIVTFTHKGWFGICPVYFAEPYSQAPYIEPRHAILSPLFWISEFMYGIVFDCVRAMRPDWEPEWPLNISGELPVPVEREAVAPEE